MNEYLVFLTDCQFSVIHAENFEYDDTTKELWFMDDNNENIAYFNTNRILGFKKTEIPKEAPIFKEPQI